MKRGCAVEGAVNNGELRGVKRIASLECIELAPAFVDSVDGGGAGGSELKFHSYENRLVDLTALATIFR